MQNVSLYLSLVALYSCFFSETFDFSFVLHHFQRLLLPGNKVGGVKLSEDLSKGICVWVCDFQKGSSLLPFKMFPLFSRVHGKCCPGQKTWFIYYWRWSCSCSHRTIMWRQGSPGAILVVRLVTDVSSRARAPARDSQPALGSLKLWGLVISSFR